MFANCSSSWPPVKLPYLAHISSQLNGLFEFWKALLLIPTTLTIVKLLTDTGPSKCLIKSWLLPFHLDFMTLRWASKMGKRFIKLAPKQKNTRNSSKSMANVLWRTSKWARHIFHFSVLEVGLCFASSLPVKKLRFSCRYLVTSCLYMDGQEINIFVLSLGWIDRWEVRSGLACQCFMSVLMVPFYGEFRQPKILCCWELVFYYQEMFGIYSAIRMVAKMLLREREFFKRFIICSKCSKAEV